MAQLIDPETNEVIAETSHLTEDDAVDTTEDSYEETVEESAAEPEREETLPDKYKGKSASDIARMHQELEKRLGEQSSEVGELRKAFDDMVKSSMAAQQKPQEPEQEIDFFADPEAAVRKAIENHPTLKQTQEVALQMARAQSLAALQSAHPDMKEILSDKQFQEWVGKSKYRQQMYLEADQQYNFEAANELLSTYKEIKGVVKQTQRVEKVAQKNEVKKASTGSSRSNPEGQSTRKTYRRRDIIELMNRDPKRYEALLPEIMKAYQEGRVK